MICQLAFFVNLSTLCFRVQLKTKYDDEVKKEEEKKREKKKERKAEKMTAQAVPHPNQKNAKRLPIIWLTSKHKPNFKQYKK